MFMFRKKKSFCSSVRFFDEDGAPSFLLLGLLVATAVFCGCANVLIASSYKPTGAVEDDDAYSSDCTPNQLTVLLIKEQCFNACTLVRYLNSYTDGLKFEGIVGGYIMTQLMFVFALSAQVPTPKGLLGTVCFWIYIVCIVLQGLFTLVALVPFYTSNAIVMHRSKECFVSATGPGGTLFSASFILSSAFHPFVQTNLNLLLVHVLLLTQAARVRKIAEKSEDISSFWVSEEKWPWRSLLCVYAWPLCSTLLFVFTIACVFSLTFVLILLMEGAIMVLVFFFFAWVHWRTDTIGNDDRSYPMELTFGYLHGATTAHGALSTQTPYRDHGGLFYRAALAPLATFALSTLVIPGTLLAWVVFSPAYTGSVTVADDASGSGSGLVEFVSPFYRHHFELFLLPFDLDVPSYALNLTNMISALDKLPDISDPSSWEDPQQLASTSQGFWTLNVLLSVLKIMLTMGTAAMSVLGYAAPNVPTNLCAGSKHFDIGIVLDHIDDGEEELEGQQKTLSKCCRCTKRAKKKKKKTKGDGFAYFEMS
jgi:hypothetical protein